MIRGCLKRMAGLHALSRLHSSTASPNNWFLDSNTIVIVIF